jgi:uncharacterized protein
MIFPDVNLLLYAYDTSSEFHEDAANWLEEALSSSEVFFSWHTITAFLRITTHPTALKNPTTIKTAMEIVDSWMVLENTHLIALEKKNWTLFSRMLSEGQASGNLVMDAHLAAMAASCGATMATTDKDFSRFPGIQTVNPLR